VKYLSIRAEFQHGCGGTKPTLTSDAEIVQAIP